MQPWRIHEVIEYYKKIGENKYLVKADVDIDDMLEIRVVLES